MSKEKEIIFKLSNEEDINRFKTIENFISIFKCYKKKPPLKEALKDLYLNSNQKISDEIAIEIANTLYDECKSYVGDNFNKIEEKHRKITKEDAIIICSYTREIPGKYKNKYNTDSPYKILNQSMTSEDRDKGIQNVGKYLLVLLLALRKLEKCYKDCLYRGIRTNVIKDKDTKGNEYKYKIGDIKKWWGFTSSSDSKTVAVSFLDKRKYGTIFEIKCSKLWGYDLSDFSMFSEKEILFIPEREIEIKDIKQIDDYALIECRMLTDSSLILEDCNECPKCGSLDVERTNKVEKIDFGGLEGIFKDIFNNEQQKNFISDQLLKSFNRVNDKKYKCKNKNCSHEYELSHN